MTRHTVILLKKIRTYKIVKCKVQKGSLKLPRSEQETSPVITPDNIWEEEKPRWKFWRNPKRIILHYEGNMKPIAVHEGDPPKLNMGFLNLDEIIESIKKAVILAISRIKPLKTELFLILAIIGVINLVLTAFALFKIIGVTG